VLLCLICAPVFVDLVDHDAPQASAGTVDFSDYGQLTSPVGLGGDWKMTWEGSGGYPGGPPPGTSGFAHVPGPWKGQTLAGHELPERGAVAYELTIKGLRPGRYLLHIPQLYEASRVSLNGQVVSERGQWGLTPGAVRYEVRSQDIPVEADGLDLLLKVELASFLHRDTGIETAPALGLAEPMSRWTTLSWLRGSMFVTATVLLGCFGLVVFFFRRKDQASLFIAIATLSLIPIAAIFSHDNLIVIAFPGMTLRTMLTLQYLSGIAALACFFGYTHHLFPRESSRRAFWFIEGLLAVAFLAHAAALAAGDTLLASQLSFWMLPLRGAIFAYMVWIVVRAVIRGRNSAPLFLLGITVFITSLFSYDLLTNGMLRQDKVGVDLPALGMLVLLFSHIVILAERWTLSIDAAEQTADDLRGLLDVNAAITSEIELTALLRQIVRVTSRIINADRSSLFLHDEKTNELWSLVAEGLETREIRFPADVGLAGASFTSGQPINIHDAYADPRFNRDVDAMTGYRTASVLTIPVTARDGRRLGVLQALNRQDRKPFGDGDVARISAFAAQAAIAIDNAKLFTEVASERNYNEAILRSMSSGVVTLDPDARVAKLNAAAARILRIAPERLAGADARAWMAETNPGLLAEIDAVSASGQPKALFDADLRTGGGATISANISIVPLVLEGDPVGVLILVEDITEGKRLQGAMRRYMSQEVVDQVLSKDDLLFGDACRASVLFSDIRNFTSLAEQLTPRATVETLNEVYTELFEAVAASNGVLDKFLGDGLMAHWGAPVATDRDPLNAIESAAAMLRLAEALNVKRRAKGLAEIRLGMGVSTGEVVAGAIGSPKRMDYTVIGDSVNLAARLEQLTKVYGVSLIADEATAAALAASPFVLRDLDTVRVRGRQTVGRIFEVLTPDDPLPEAALAAYADGRRALAERRWSDAIAAFEAALAAAPDDVPAALMLARAKSLKRAPPPADWDGVWGEG
jgi:adenylate cyclase